MLNSKVRNAVSTALGSKIAMSLSTTLAKVGLRGLGINVHYAFEHSGEAWLFKRAFGTLREPACLDVGANIGDFVREARAYGASCVVAFEPVPETFNILQAAVQKDKAVRLFCSAVGETEGTTQFFVPLRTDKSVLASRDIGITEIDPDDARKITVPITTVDAIRASQDIHFDIIKIDVEGYEFEVLRGAEETIRSFPPSLLQFEFNAHHAHRRQTMQDFANLLPGYRLFRLAASSLRPLDTSHYLSTIYAYQNIICIHKSADALLKALT